MYGNYQSSSYYRSNPYKQLNYLPPGAHKNRKQHQFYAEIPQGVDAFMPTTKKHYNNAYNSQIQHDHIMADSGVRSPLEKQAVQRSYFRSLNSKDIEGAYTNTLISKAVKNKMKAQKELERKRREQEQKKIEQSRIKKQIEQYTSHNAVMTRINNNNQSNYHQKPQNNNNSLIDEKKIRENQLMKLAQQRKNYAVVSLESLKNRENFHTTNLKNNKSNTNIEPIHHQQQQHPIQNNSYQQPQPQYNKYEQNHQNSTLNIEPLTHKPQNNKNIKNYHQDHQQDYEYMQMMRQKQLYDERERVQGADQEKQKQYQRNLKSRETYKDQNREQEFNSYEKNGHSGEVQHRQQQYNYNNGYRDNFNSNPYHQQYQNNPNQPLSDFRKQQQIKERIEREREQYGRGYGKIQPNNHSFTKTLMNPDSPPQFRNQTPQKTTFVNREDLRRHNPTFLSYGSPSFSVAYRNIMNY